MNETRDSRMVTWSVDPLHTTVGFSVRHMMATHVRGTFESVRGAVRFDAGRPEAIEIEADIRAAEQGRVREGVPLLPVAGR